MSDRTRRMVIAAGGTGGHMFPAVSTAEELLQRGWSVDVLTDMRGARYLADHNVRARVSAVPLGSPYRGGVVARAAAPVLLGWAAIRLAVIFFLARPACVIAFGGYATAPALAAASVLGIPRLVHEQNAILGRVNRFFLRFGARLACGVAQPPDAPRESEVVGVPVRSAVSALADRPYSPPGDVGRVHVVVVGGSQGSRAVARLAAGALACAPAPLRHRLCAVCQVRDADRAEVEGILGSAGVEAETAPFFPDLPARLAASQLVVARSGASTLAELSAIGRPAILIPLPTAAADHQSWNARAYAGTGAARVFDENGGSAETLGSLISSLLHDSVGLGNMASAARDALRTGAAGRLASLAEHQSGVVSEVAA